MILPDFEYRKAETVADAIGLYNEFAGNVRYLAGGTDLMPLLKHRLSTPAVVIDLKGILDLSTITAQDGWLTIGANVTLFALKQNQTIRDYFPVFYQSLEATACETLQMRGTIGGNLLQDTRCIEYNKSNDWRVARGFCLKMGGKTCNVVPGARVCLSNYCSDNALALISLSATVKVIGPGGERAMAIEEIFSGKGSKPFALEPGEILTHIRIPMEKSKGAYEKLRVRKSIDYPLVAVAACLKEDNARICVGGIGPAPRVYDLKGLGTDRVVDASRSTYADAKAVSNTTLSPEYRKRMAGVLFRRAVNKALKEEK
ncbi:putative 4-hydroxybenzoyl-CoA reductase, beta subunit [Desulfosarcina cetonica]|uniref:FAD binding domain-containing protein n=1 Tax=Desulfosarcina cetonica TaxID=90730 RepID=UPI0006D0A317|nr:FAD binding domain-containing protein [Desulfosarcina cetonica]VTR70255.1 putative 4-hydroxybenzoyl-CoA reductase, beta subunit [Desulfosarcina cetonica]